MKNNEFCKEIDKELKEMFEELKMVYKHLDKLSFDSFFLVLLLT